MQTYINGSNVNREHTSGLVHIKLFTEELMYFCIVCPINGGGYDQSPCRSIQDRYSQYVRALKRLWLVTLVLCFDLDMEVFLMK